MSDLISREEVFRIIKPRLNSSYFGTLGYQRLNSIFEEINNLPTAFDLESVIDAFETYKSQQAENEMLSDNGKWLAKRIIEECEKIIKSATNTTNGKNGG